KTPDPPIIFLGFSRTREYAIRSTTGVRWAGMIGHTGSSRCGNISPTCSDISSRRAVEPETQDLPNSDRIDLIGTLVRRIHTGKCGHASCTKCTFIQPGGVSKYGWCRSNSTGLHSGTPASDECGRSLPAVSNPLSVIPCQ